MTKKHRCHVFRCDVPARAVARALLESHQKERTAKAGGRRKESSPSAASAVPLPERRKRDSTEGSSGNGQILIFTFPEYVCQVLQALLKCHSLRLDSAASFMVHVDGYA